MGNVHKAYCQSCGVAFDEGHNELIGKEKNGSNSPYCKYCYQDGIFTDPDATLEDMVDKSLPHLASQMGEEEARAELYRTLPRLARWAK